MHQKLCDYASSNQMVGSEVCVRPMLQNKFSQNKPDRLVLRKTVLTGTKRLTIQGGLFCETGFPCHFSQSRGVCFVKRPGSV
jgi:hypothetical protein